MTTIQREGPFLYLGTFNAEQFWRESQLCKLPTVPDKQADAIVGVMDELGFVFCNSSDDVVLTRLPLDSAHQNYLRGLGFAFLNNELSLVEQENENAKGLGANQSICRLLTETANQRYFQALLSAISCVSPYAIGPFTDSFCQSYKLRNPGPDIDIVKKVNSKLFSHQLAKQLFEETVGEIVYSANVLETTGRHLLEHSPFLIKDEFGVSGKGNMLISSERMLRRIVKHIAKQEKAGKQTRFLLEPFLDKQIDFSCQFAIGATGETHIVSIQQMQNAGFAFWGIQTAEPALLESLNRAGYFEQVEAIATALYQAGYYGPVCLDSMRLKDGTIVPVVEINARQSMGLVNHYVDRFLAHFSVQGNLRFFSLGLTRHVPFAELLSQMAQADILFGKDKPHGILPLTANTLNVNWRFNRVQNNNKNTNTRKGRLYFSLVSDSEEDRERTLHKMDRVFDALGIRKFR